MRPQTRVGYPPHNGDVRVLLTGGTGFIGSRVLDRLLERGHQVNLVINKTAPSVPEGPSVKYYKIDLTDPVNFRRVGFKAQAAINVAGQLRIPGIAEAKYWKIHYEATKHILEECTRFKLKRLIQVSTTGVYGVTGKTPAKEEGPINPGDIYERTKWESEQYAQEYCSGGEIALTIIRPSLVYGPGDRHLLGLFKTIKSGLFRIIGDGENFVHPIFVDDLSRGIVDCLDNDESRGRTYNLVGERPVTFREFCQAVAQALGKNLPRATIPTGLAWTAGLFFEGVRAVSGMDMPLTRDRVDFMTSSRAYDPTRAREELGFTAETSLNEGMRRTVEWYRQEKLI
jgi:nucleoside-diphosphate-sugar epimerase